MTHDPTPGGARRRLGTPQLPPSGVGTPRLPGGSGVDATMSPSWTSPEPLTPVPLHRQMLRSTAAGPDAPTGAADVAQPRAAPRRCRAAPLIVIWSCQARVELADLLGPTGQAEMIWSISKWTIEEKGTSGTQPTWKLFFMADLSKHLINLVCYLHVVCLSSTCLTPRQLC